MPRPARINDDLLIDEAIDLLETSGPDGLTMSTLAGRLRVKTPSLYNHVSGIEDLRVRVRIAAVNRLGDALGDATMGRAGADALVAFCQAYRSFAAANPELYELWAQAQAGEDDELDHHAWRALRPLYAVLNTEGLSDARTVHTSRVVRAALHGFVSLENSGAFGLPASVDESFEELVDCLLALLDA